MVGIVYRAFSIGGVYLGSLQAEGGAVPTGFVSSKRSVSKGNRIEGSCSHLLIRLLVHTPSPSGVHLSPAAEPLPHSVLAASPITPFAGWFALGFGGLFVGLMMLAGSVSGGFFGVAEIAEQSPSGS